MSYSEAKSLLNALEIINIDDNFEIALEVISKYGNYKKALQATIGIDLKKDSDCDVLADAHYLPFRDKIFSKIYCFEVLEHLESPIQALREFSRVLDGSLLLTVPNLRYWTRILRWVLNKEVVTAEHHIQAWYNCRSLKEHHIQTYNN